MPDSGSPQACLKSTLSSPWIARSARCASSNCSGVMPFMLRWTSMNSAIVISSLPSPDVGPMTSEPRRDGSRGATRGAFQQAWLRSDLRLQPPAERLGLLEELDQSVLGLRRSQPRPRRPLLPRDQSLIAEQFDPRMILGV